MGVEWNWLQMLNGKSKDIAVGQDKTQLLRGSSFMQQKSLGIYNVYLSKKTNIVDIWHSNSRKMIYLKKYYLLFTFSNKNLFKYLHLLFSSDFLLRRSLPLTNLMINKFSVRHIWQNVEQTLTKRWARTCT